MGLWLLSPLRSNPMSDHHVSLAANEARIDSVEKAFDKIIVLIEGQSKILQGVNTAVRLLEQNHSSLDRMQTNHASKIELLMDNKATMKGGWLALSAIGAVLVGLSSIIGALVAWLALRHT